MSTTGGSDPTDLRNLPEPADLHSALARTHPLNWGNRVPTKAQLLDEFGAEATRLTLQALQERVASERAATDDFVAALSDDSSSYKLESRVKSPQSLARKYSDRLATLDDEEPDDILRYTMLTDSPRQLVAETQQTVDRLRDAGWQPIAAMHSYTEGSRYKGIHVGFQLPSGGVVEVQFHSAESARVKEATTTPYEIERSADASPAQRSAARALCIKLSDSLEPPPGIAVLRTLGGQPVEVNTFGDSRREEPPQPARIKPHTQAPPHPAYRLAGRQVDGTSR
ncbi:hypothetical protein AB0P21_23425 [Kribbella sp. NPDC056861]|uniref:hypothetical protein n=1 Tax=Kribbella sp. NPDC056861 TaxID=3154857 RepID=UPI00342327A1